MYESTWGFKSPLAHFLDLSIALISFWLIFLGELPDKTMFANLIMATRGRPRQVWLGAAGAFAVHVAIAVTAGAILLSLVSHRVVEGVVAGLFLAGAGYSWWLSTRDEAVEGPRETSRRGVVLTASVVIFLAEWGDLTQFLTANLAARYHSALSVAIGAVLGLWVVAALAVTSGQAIMRFVSMATVRRVTAVVLLGLAAYSAWSAFG